MITLLGLLTIFSVVIFLLTGKGAPIIGLILFPLLGAILAGFGPAELGVFFTQGLSKVIQVAAMFIFAITFFGIMQDVGLFRPLIKWMLTITKGNVIAVTVGTALLGMLAHLDGAGATTFLLMIPALLPLYKKLRMSPYLMLMVLALGAGILNMLPWAGPLGRAAAVTGIDVSMLWRPIIAVQLTGVVLLVLLAVVLGVREKRRISAQGLSAGHAGSEHIEEHDRLSSAEEALLRPKLLWLNALIFLSVLGALVVGILPSAYIFMIGLSVALLVNYPSLPMQMERFKAHAPNALMMGAIILAAGSFLGMMDGTGMLKSIAADLVTILPASMVPHLHIILGIFGLPMELVLSTDAYYFGLLPIVMQIVSMHGVEPAVTVYALVIGNVVGTFISPFSPALWLALGLANLEMGKHIRYSLFWMWGLSLCLLGVAVLLGVIPL